MTLISGKLMYIGVISVIIIAVASYGLFFFFQESGYKKQKNHCFRMTNSLQVISIGTNKRIHV